MEKDYLIEKWLSNELTEAEQKRFEQLEDYDFYTEIISSGQHFKASHFSTPPPFEALETRITSEVVVKKLGWVTPLLRLTGAIVIGLGIYFLFFFNNVTQIQTLASQKTTIELPDASTVTLNALSELSFSKNKWNQKREVDLNGEAFFKVAKGKVFDVITSEGIVTVVGTQFNVKQRDDYFEVICYEGIVRVSAGENTKELLAGNTFRRSGSGISTGTTTYQLPQWTKNISDFYAVPIREVIAELERQYNIKVTYDNAIEGRLFTGGFVHNNLDHALRSITEPQGLTYTIKSSNQVTLQNSGQK